MRSPTAQNWLRAMGGAVAGAVLGYMVFRFMARNGLYAMVLPGSLVGMVAGRTSGTESKAIGIACAVIAAILSVFVEWRFLPFVKDDSFSYLATHLHDLPPAHLLMMVIGVAFAFWFGRGRARFTSSPA